ncbi:MAG: pitrilysin family protein [Chitinophagales bacterium]|nr:pitrilysin family protein [Chitinophagales bacterium]
MTAIITYHRSMIAVFLLCFIAVGAFAQTKEFTVDGLKVILKNTPKEVISARLFVEGGTANYPKAKEGIESLAFNIAMTGGTTKLNKVDFNTQAEKIGTSFGSESTYDFGSMSMTCIKMFWDKSWELYTDAIMNPAFDPKEFKLTQEQMITAAKEAISNPDAYLRQLAMKNAFAGTNYEKVPNGSPESLAKITLDDVKQYYKNTIGKQRVFLVVVGNITEADLTAKIKKSLSKLALGTPATFEKRTLITTGGDFIEDRDIATNYIRGVMSAPTWNEADGIPMRVAMSIMNDRFFLELRTKRSLSYAPAAFYSSGVIKNPYNAIYITTTDPKQSMSVMVEIIDSVKKYGFKEGELVNTKQGFLTDYFMGQESSSSQSQTLGMAEIAGDWTLAETFTEKVNAVTLKDLNRVFDKYSKAIKWTYLGKQSAVNKADFKQADNKPKENRPY